MNHFVLAIASGVAPCNSLSIPSFVNNTLERSPNEPFWHAMCSTSVVLLHPSLLGWFDSPSIVNLSTTLQDNLQMTLSTRHPQWCHSLLRPLWTRRGRPSHDRSHTHRAVVSIHLHHVHWFEYQLLPTTTPSPPPPHPSHKHRAQRLMHSFQVWRITVSWTSCVYCMHSSCHVHLHVSYCVMMSRKNVDVFFSCLFHWCFNFSYTVNKMPVTAIPRIQYGTIPCSVNLACAPVTFWARYASSGYTAAVNVVAAAAPERKGCTSCLRRHCS